MSERSVYLYCTEGGSDKEYHLHLRARDGAWAIDYANGKRGAVGQSKVKKPPMGLDAATLEFDKIIKSKLKDGYTPAESGVRFTDTEHAHLSSGHVQQLSSAIDEAGAEAKIQDALYGAQEKANGERRSILVVGDHARGINKLGLFVNLPENIAHEMRAFGDSLFDGEQVGTNYFVFDLLKLNGRDLRALPFGRRYEILSEEVLGGMFRPSSSCLHLLEVAFTTAEKRALFERVRDANGEGLVFKDLSESYEGGRSRQAWKYKFNESSTFQVLEINKQRSVQIGLFNASGELVPLGNVTIPPNAAIPDKGDLIEVEYLYFTGSAFEQPVFIGPRNDVLPEEVTFSQVTRVKPGIELDDQGARQFERQRG